MSTRTYTFFFTDYNTAFDKFPHEQLMETFKTIQINYNNLRTITNLYQKIKIKRGVRHDCLLTPIFFNTYTEEILSKTVEGETAGMKDSGTPINKLNYADNAVMFSYNLEYFQKMMNTDDDSREYVFYQ